MQDSHPNLDSTKTYHLHIFPHSGSVQKTLTAFLKLV